MSIDPRVLAIERKLNDADRRIRKLIVGHRSQLQSSLAGWTIGEGQYQQPTPWVPGPGIYKCVFEVHHTSALGPVYPGLTFEIRLRLDVFTPASGILVRTATTDGSGLASFYAEGGGLVYDAWLSDQFPASGNFGNLTSPNVGTDPNTVTTKVVWTP